MSSKEKLNYSITESKFKVWGLFKYRKIIHNIFLKSFFFSKETTILDMGTTEILDKYENYLLHHYKYKKNLTCLSNQNLKNIKKLYPEIKTIHRDGRNTKIKNKSYDIVYSSATVEHVGNLKNQTRFIKEMHRIAKRGVFLTTPNRYFPLEIHTLIPLIHMLPKKIHRFLLNILGYKFLAKEENLNLLSEADLRKICQELNIKNYIIKKVKIFIFTSNLLLTIKK